MNKHQTAHRPSRLHWLPFLAVVAAMAFLLARAACGCAPHEATSVLVTPRYAVRPVYISRHFTPTQAADIFEAVQRWNVALNGHVYLDVVSGSADLSEDERKDVYENHGVSFDVVFSDCGCIPLPIPKAVAWTDQVDGTQIRIVHDLMDESWYLPVAMHELGHTLGAPDSDRRDTIMAGELVMVSWPCVDLATLAPISKLLATTDLRGCT